jgi:hypothetical protein
LGFGAVQRKDAALNFDSKKIRMRIFPGIAADVTPTLPPPGGRLRDWVKESRKEGVPLPLYIAREAIQDFYVTISRLDAFGYSQVHFRKAISIRCSIAFYWFI